MQSFQANTQVVLFTIIELYNEEDTTINHHGFARDVADLKVESKFSYKEKVFNWAKIIGRFNECIYLCNANNNNNFIIYRNKGGPSLFCVLLVLLLGCGNIRNVMEIKEINIQSRVLVSVKAYAYHRWVPKSK